MRLQDIFSSICEKGSLLKSLLLCRGAMLLTGLRSAVYSQQKKCIAVFFRVECKDNLL